MHKCAWCCAVCAHVEVWKQEVRSLQANAATDAPYSSGLNQHAKLPDMSVYSQPKNHAPGRLSCTVAFSGQKVSGA